MNSVDFIENFEKQYENFRHKIILKNNVIVINYKANCEKCIN